MNCNLLEAKLAGGQSIYYCPVCERHLQLPSGLKPVRRCPRGRCLHLGGEVRQQRCTSCAGLVNIRVYQCAVHGEATIAKKFNDVRGCDLCSDYKTVESM